MRDAEVKARDELERRLGSNSRDAIFSSRRQRCVKIRVSDLRVDDLRAEMELAQSLEACRRRPGLKGANSSLEATQVTKSYRALAASP